MAKLTTRDYVWDAALRVAYREAEGMTIDSFGHEDVAREMDNPPSSKTIRETLQSMAELGHLQESWPRGTYHLPRTWPFEGSTSG